MKRCGHRGTRLGGLCAIGLMGVSLVWAQTAAPPAPAKAKLERLKIAVAPLGWDTNFTWLNPRSGNLDKRPALEFLVGIDRHTGAYIPELAEKWEMAPDGKTWTITLRQGVTFHDNWGEFTAKDVRHAVFLITQPESVQSDASTWRTLMGVAKTDTSEDVAKKVEQGVDIIDDYTVVFRLKQAVPEYVTRLATLLSGEVHISDVPRALQKDAVAKGMQVLTSQLPAIQHQWQFGGMYFATPDKLDPTVPFVKKEVRQAMNLAINRQAIAENLLGGRVEAHRVHGYHPKLDSAIWPGIWNPDWDKRFEELYGYDPARAKALLQQAGYPNGFAFTTYLYTLPGLPEMVDIGQALALDWQAIGLKPQLVEIDFPRVREKFRTKTIHGAVFPTRHALRALDTIRLAHKAKDSTAYFYEHPFIEERLEALGKVVDPGERARLLREIGDHKFTEFAEIPLFWLFAEAAVNPKYVAEYVFPGVITGSFTHLEYVKPAP